MKRWLLLAALLLLGYVMGKPHRPGAAGILLDADGDYYLEFEAGSWSEGFLDPHNTLTLYLCESNGWFHKPTRTQLWIGDCECDLAAKKVEFLPRHQPFDGCVRMQVPLSGAITPAYSALLSQNGTLLTYCF